MVTDPGSLRGELRDSTEHAWRLYCALEVMIPYRETDPQGRVRFDRRKLTASTVAWHSTAAMLVTDLHADVRRLEACMREQVTGTLIYRRGGSRDNTRYALKAVANLAEAVSDETALDALNALTRWIRRTNAVFDPDKQLHHIPRAPGEGEMRCPYCQRTTMRWHPPSGIAVCISPECVTDDGVRPRWMAQFTVVNSELIFSWELQEAA